MEFTKSELESALLGIKGMKDDPKLKSCHLYNALALLHLCLGEGSWVGLYLAKEDELLLGPFQGTPACERIAFGKGVVGTSFQKERTVSIPDVRKIENYICCDASAISEICVPMKVEGKTVAILDIDLPFVHDFSEEETTFEAIADAMSKYL